MVAIYIRAILDGKKTVADVKPRWHDEVAAYFAALLDDGKITQEQYDAYMGIDG